MKRESGFTLLELAVVVLILSILVVLAVPSFGAILHRSRAAEARVLLEGIAQAQLEYYRDHGTFRACAPSSVEVPAGGETQFDSSGQGWSDIGFAVDGNVRYQYSVEVQEDRFVAVARGDLDGDGELSTYSIDSKLLVTTENELE